MKYEIAGKIIMERREIVPYSGNNLYNNIVDIARAWQGAGLARKRMFQKNKEFDLGMMTRVGCGTCNLILSIESSH